MVLARHWRILCAAAQSGTNIAMAEVEWRATAGGADLTAPAGAATASSRWINSATYDAIQAFDNDAATWWETAAGFAVGSWIAYDFGSDVEPVELSIQAQATNPSKGVKDGTVQYSADGVTWVDLMYFAGLTWTNGSINLLSLPLAPGAALARITTFAGEVLHSGANPSARMSFLAAEVLRSISDAPAAPAAVRRRQLVMG